MSMMKAILTTLTRADQWVARAEAWALIAMVAVMTAVVLLQVICRYVLSQSLDWSEELARYLFVWISMVGAALSIKKRGHFEMDFFFRMFPEKVQRVAIYLIYLLMGVVVLVILVQGVVLLQRTSAQTSPAMQISMGMAYACLPVGAALMALHLLVIILKEPSEGRREDNPS